MADDDLENRVKAAYRRHFNDTRNSTDAWNRTLADVAGNDVDPAGDGWAPLRASLRGRVIEILKRVQAELLAEMKDPFTMAVDAAMRDLRRDNVTEYVRREYREADQIHRDQVKKDLKLDVPEGPKEWSPSKAKREEDLERAVERDRDRNPSDMTLYVTFDELGALQGWTVDYPDFWQGHGGPVAAILASDRLDYDEIRREVEDALSELDWDEIAGELEDDDGA